MAEMIIVISVIAILVTVGMYSFSKLLPRGRDQRRQADLAQIQFALEKYRSDNPTAGYPHFSITERNGCIPGVGLCLLLLKTGNYITLFTQDLNSNTKYYYRGFQSVPGDIWRYELCAYLDTNPASTLTTNCFSDVAPYKCGDKRCNYRVTGP